MFDQKLEEQARRWFADHQAEMTRDLARMVAVPSVSCPEDTAHPPFGRACREMADLFLQMAAEYGFETQNYGYYCARASLGAGQELAFWSHLDVVEAGTGWRFEPFALTERDGYLIGRGAQDNKGSAVCVLFLMRFLKETGYPLRHKLSLYVGFSEENGMADAAWFAASQRQPPLSIVADCAFPVCIGERGTLNVRLTAQEEAPHCLLALEAGDRIAMLPAHAALQADRQGLACPAAWPKGVTAGQEGDRLLLRASGTADHAAMPGPAPNALHLLARAACDAGIPGMEFLRDTAADPSGAALGVACADEPSGPAVCGVTMAGLAQRRLWFTASIKFPVTQKGKAVLRALQEAAAARGFDTEVLRLQEPVYHARLGPVVRGLTEIYNRVSGQKSEPFVMSGGTYARKLKNALPFGTGLPMPPRPPALFAPGHGDYHQADECIEIERMQMGCRVYAACVFWLNGLDLHSDIYGE